MTHAEDEKARRDGRHGGPAIGARGPRVRRWDLLVLTLLMAVWCVWHVPLLYRVAAGQDEDFYAVPGIMVARRGVPSIPYLPSRDPASICYRADEALFTLPPLYFYLAGLTHLVLGEGLGQARVASAVAGMGAVLAVYSLSRIWFGGSVQALIAAGLFLFSRPFGFAATTARPDMTAAALGLAAVACVEVFVADRKWSWALAGGMLAGLSLLSHPFAVVIVAACGVRLALLCRRDGPGPLALFGLAAGLAFGLWLPLIARYPELFWAQFGTNVLGRSGPGLVMTAQGPGAIVSYQLARVWEYLMPWQSITLAIGLAGLAWAGRRPGPARAPFFHAGIALALMILLLGRHPALGYYVYPAGLACVGVGYVVEAFSVRVGRFRPRHAVLAQRVGLAVALLVLAVAWTPGCGVRVLLAHWRHWDDPSYDVRRFGQVLVADVPPRGLTAVDGPYVLQFFLADRRVVQAFVYPFYFDFSDLPVRAVILGPDGARQVGPLLPRLVPMRRYGPEGEELACRATRYDLADAANEPGP